MAQGRSMDIETAKKFLRRNFEIFKNYNKELRVFKITGKEAFLLSMYSEAFFILDETYHFKFSRNFNSVSADLETVDVIKQEWDNDFCVPIPIFSAPASYYFQKFIDLNNEKYLFLIDKREFIKGKKNPWFDFKELVGYLKNRISDNKTIGLKDCIIWLTSSNGTFGEDFWEYVGGLVLKEKGYIVTGYKLSTNDLAAYYIPDYINKLVKRGFLSKGAFIEELEMLEQKSNNIKLDLPEIKDFELVAIEAESSDINTKKDDTGHHAIKYLSDYRAGYTHAFTVGPFVKASNYQNPKIGLISFDETKNFELVFRPGNGNEDKVREERVELIKNLIKCSLLKNLTFEERCELIGIQPTNLRDYFKKILNLDIDIILDKIGEKLNV
ncbi:MAG: hypothetical protein IB618_01875 [Candidatus Pacearchaeota archaeon]|nr:MAG: hypothetical protein IB618_01875 [Candidatus Pacearchaeota archaeon]